MIDLILEHKWAFFILGEVIFWGSIIGFLLLRYVFDLKKVSKYMIFVWLISDLWLLTIGILDFRHTGQFNSFQLVIVAALIYALTAGKKDLRALEIKIKRLISRWRGEKLPDSEPMADLQTETTKKPMKSLLLHTLLFACVMAFFAWRYGFRDFDVMLELKGERDWIRFLLEYGFFPGPPITRISGVWALILLLDMAFTISQALFGSKRMQKSETPS